MIWQELKSLSTNARAFLLAVFLLFNLFAFVRAMPVNSSLPENRQQERGDYDHNVYRVHRLAMEAAAHAGLRV